MKSQEQAPIEPRVCAVCAGTGKVTEAIDGYLYEVPCGRCHPPGRYCNSANPNFSFG